MFENNQRTEVSDLGEFRLIDHLSGFFQPKHKTSILGIGEDASVLEYGDSRIVISTQHMMEGVHFDLTFHPLKHLGYKSVVNAIADLCAMNTVPREIQVNIAVSNRFSLEAIEEIFIGVRAACDKYNLDLVGLRASSSFKGLMLSTTAVGDIHKSKLVSKTGASANDLLVITGDIGGAYMGLQILEREKKVFLEHPEMQPDLEQNDYIVGRQLKPEARTDVVDILNTLKIVPTSMGNVRHGVAGLLFEMGKKSKVGFEVFENKLPVDPQTVERALEFGLNPSIAALNGGEDFEILFTINQQDYDKIKNNPDFTIIGHATDNQGAFHLVTNSGNSFDIKAQGWNNPTNFEGGNQ